MTDLTTAGDHNRHDLEAIRREIVRVAPEFLREAIAVLGEGMDSFAVLVGDAVLFRFAKHDDAAKGLRREIALLPRLAPGLSLAIPRFQYVGKHSVTKLSFVGYTWRTSGPHAPGRLRSLRR
jgi:hypothetical protein